MAPHLLKSRSFVFVAATAVVGLLLAAPALAVRTDGAIAEGNLVRFHFAVYDQQDALRHTSDPHLAAGALENGNPYLEANLSSPVYGIREGRARVDPSPADLRALRIQPSQFVIGARAGDRVLTPFVVHPYGASRTYEMPSSIGPLEVHHQIDLAALYDATNGTEATNIIGPREAFVEGATIPYADLLHATVVRVQGDNASVRVDVATGDRVFSQVLGFNFSVERLANGSVILHPDLAVGDVFQTRGCKLPLSDLLPGRYRVLSVRHDAVVIKEELERYAHLMDATLRFEFRILSVDEWPEVRMLQESFHDAAARLIKEMVR